MEHILVIGATGNVGSAVVSELIRGKTPVRALSRNPDAAQFPQALDVVKGDLTLPDSLDAALADVESVFVVWTAPHPAFAPALERIAKTARRIVYLSAPFHTPHPFFQQPHPSRAPALERDHLIETSGLEWTILRPHMFASNARLWWGAQIRAGDVVRWPYLDAATAPIDDRDIAAVGVRALCEPGHAGKDYVITGPQSLTHAEQIGTIGRVLSRSLRIEEMSPDDARGEWQSTFPPVVIEMLLGAWAAAVGRPAWTTNTVAEVTGRSARTFHEWAVDSASFFRA
jgi:uncharacterized protein YbjT (DUF2867 family)